MEEGQSSSNSIPHFLSKTYEMVSDPSTDAIISWSCTSKSFIVWNQPDFSKDLLPKFFKHNNFSSFIRQLNTYGFRKVDQEQWEFANEYFIRDQPHLMNNIHRRKPVHSHSLTNAHDQQAATDGASAAPLTDSERWNLKAEIEKLKHEKAQLLMEFQMQEEEWKQNEMQLHDSKDRLQKLEVNQQSMISSVGQVLQKSSEEVGLQSVTVNSGRKRTCLRNNLFNNLATIEIPLKTSELSSRGKDESVSVLSINMERLNLLESSLTFWENIVNDVSDIYFQTHSNLNLDDSLNCGPDPIISYVRQESEVHLESPGNNMNSLQDLVAIPNPGPVAPEPAVNPVIDAPNPVAPKEQPVATTPVTTGYNSPFWEKYLVENPDLDESENLSELSKFCWSRNNK